VLLGAMGLLVKPVLVLTAFFFTTEIMPERKI
jgi:hypothetical protein